MSLTVHTREGHEIPVPDGDATDVDALGNLTVYRHGQGIALFAAGEWRYVSANVEAGK